jgi:peptidoglycan/xylan/chitin deacetylase (PgdA/CDA1 family)
MQLRTALASALLLLGSLATASTKPIHVAMIFDDGPDPVQTPKLLAIFAEEQVHVTFGTVAKNAEAHPALIKTVAAAGHELANHSYSHLHPKGLSAAALESEIVGAENKIRTASGFTPKWYWPPFIEIDDNVRAYAAKAGIKIYQPRKLVVSGDYMNDLSAEEILRRATTGVEDGSVILFHEWRAETVAQMKAIITELKRQGCVFVTFSEMEQQLPR